MGTSFGRSTTEMFLRRTFATLAGDSSPARNGHMCSQGGASKNGLPCQHKGQEDAQLRKAVGRRNLPGFHGASVVADRRWEEQVGLGRKSFLKPCQASVSSAKVFLLVQS